MKVFRKTFTTKRAFHEPADIYVIKEANSLTCCQVSSRDLQIQGLFTSPALLDFPDYTRIARRKEFDENIEIDCADDLVLVDGDVCDICKLPRQIDEIRIHSTDNVIM